MTRSEEFETEHADRVTCLHINYDGTKILTGSIDHRIKVWSVSPQTQERTLVETWTAHDADIRDAKWLHPSTGTYLGTVGNDLKFHLFGEDTSQAPNSGRRFRKIYTINSPTKVPFVSLDFRNIDGVYTYLAIIDRQGQISIYEPTNPDEFKDWTLVDRWNVVVPVPSRGEQTSFRVRWDQNVIPLPYVCGVSNDRKQLSLVVTAGNEVKIYRGIISDDDTHRSHNDNDQDQSFHHNNHDSIPGGNGDGEASHRITFYEAAKLPTHPALIRDVAWAPFNIRGSDYFATACKDGGIRIFNLSVASPRDISPRLAKADLANPASSSTSTPNKPLPTQLTRQQTQSSTLTSAITGGKQASTQQAQQQQSTTPSDSNNLQSPSASATPSRYTTSRKYVFPYTHTVSLLANLEHAHDDAWSVSWDPNGQVLVTGGADGSTKIWRRSVLDVHLNGGGGDGGGGKWMLFADQAVDVGEEGSGSEEDEEE